MRAYRTDEEWDDPYDRQAERRVARRFHVEAKLNIAVEGPQSKYRLVGPGIVENISRVGALIRTKHKVSPSQRVSVAIPTKLCQEEMCLPKAFVGGAEVVRVSSIKDNVSRVALRFGSEFSQNMEFAVFMESLQMTARIAS